MTTVPRKAEVKETVTEKLAFVFVFIFRKCLVKRQEPARYRREEKGILDRAAGIRDLKRTLCLGSCQVVHIKIYMGQWWD